MELLKCLSLASFFLIITAQNQNQNPLDFSGWPSADGLSENDRMLIINKLYALSQARGQVPIPSQILKAFITRTPGITSGSELTTYNVVYSAAGGFTCKGKIEVTVQDCVHQGMYQQERLRCTSSTQSAQCFPPGFPGLQV